MDHPSARHRCRTQARRRRLHGKAARRYDNRISHAVPIGTQHLHAALPLAAEDIAPRVHQPATVMALLTGPASWQRDITTGYARPRPQRVHACGPRRTAGRRAFSRPVPVFRVRLSIGIISRPVFDPAPAVLVLWVAGRGARRGSIRRRHRHVMLALGQRPGTARAGITGRWTGDGFAAGSPALAVSGRITPNRRPQDRRHRR